MMEPLIKISSLSKSFGSAKVLDDFSLDVNEGENIAVVGRSGSGKSVLIKCIVRLIEADKGKVEIFNRDIYSLDEKEMDRLRPEIGFLFQGSALYDSMSVGENLAFTLRRRGIKDQELIAARVNEALSQVGLLHTISLMPSDLSGGMKKRIAIARTLILQPRIIFYDEPTAGLDPVTAREIIQLMLSVRNISPTSVIISHDLYCIRKTSDKVAVLNEGRCFCLEPYENLKKSGSPIVQQYFNYND